MFLCHLQVLASVGNRSLAFSMHSQENVKNRNPFALFVMDSLVFATVCSHSYGVHKALLFSVILPTNHIMCGDFAANFKMSYSQGYSPRCESIIMLF